MAQGSDHLCEFVILPHKNTLSCSLLLLCSFLKSWIICLLWRFVSVTWPIMTLKNMWKKPTTRTGQQRNSYSAFQHQKVESCKILAFFPSQACKNIFWEAGKTASPAEAVHKISLQSHFKNHALETIFIDYLSLVISFMVKLKDARMEMSGNHTNASMGEQNWWSELVNCQLLQLQSSTVLKKCKY